MNNYSPLQGYQAPRTLLTEAHLVQILTFMEGQGIEFYPFSDVGGIRKNFIARLVKRNKLSIRLRLSALKMMETGGVLLYLRPTGRTYDIRFYDRDQYRCYYDADGELQEVFIRYSYPKRSQQSQSLGIQNLQHGGSMGMMSTGQSNANESWVKIQLTKDVFRRWDSENKPDWDENKSPQVEAENSLGFIPCVECLNINNKGEMGKPEFYDLAEEIESQHDLEQQVRSNIRKLCTSPVITSLGEDQIFDNSDTDRMSVAFASGYRAFDSDSKDNKKLKQVIGGFDRGGDGENGDFISQVTIQPLPPNQLAYVDEMGKRLRKALGGRDEREVTYTATEVRSQMGEVSATSSLKQRSLFEYGYCVLLEYAILAEESLYLASGGALGLPTAPNNLDREVKYRIGPVYEQASRERLDNSIIGRNNARAGVNQMESLKSIFPNKSEEEIKAMLNGGMPTEYLRDIIQIISMMQNIISPVSQLPLTSELAARGIDVVNYIATALSYGEPDDIFIGTSGESAKLESDSFAASQRTASVIASGGDAAKRANGVSAKPGNATAAERTSIDAEQPLPSGTGTYNDANAGTNTNGNTGNILQPPAG